MATPLLMRFNAQQQAAQPKRPAGMHCDTSNRMLNNGLFNQLNKILSLDTNENGIFVGAQHVAPKCQ